MKKIHINVGMKAKKFGKTRSSADREPSVE